MPQLTRSAEQGERGLHTSSSSLAWQRWVAHAAGLILIAAGALLLVGCFLGLYLRPTSDDWCAGWKSRDMGVLGIARDFYETQNGRIANGLISGIVYSSGLVGPKILPAVLVMALAAGLVLLLRIVWRMLGWDAPLLVMVAAVAVVEMLLFFAGTRSYQVLLWAPATITHIVPGVLAVWSVLIAIYAGRRGGRTAIRCALAVAVVTGIVIGTLSEPFTVVISLFAGTAALLLLPRRRSWKDWYPFAWCVTWCVGLAVGYVLLYTSPGAARRREQQLREVSPLSPTELIGAFHDWQHMWSAIGGQWAYLGAITVGLLLGVATARRAGPAAQDGPATGGMEPMTMDRIRTLPVSLLVLPAPLVAVSSFAVAIGVRMGSSWTYARTWVGFLFPTLLLLCMYGVVGGLALTRRWAAARDLGGRGPTRYKAPAAVAVAVVAATAVSLWAAAHLVPVVHTMAKQTVTRSVTWDRQDARIRKEVANGATVVTYRPLHIGFLAEPYYTSDYSKDWAAACVSRYYGVERIRKPAPA
ncbi:DUF6056 family protein [Streptomyces sp. KR80]|uniref:DUF6056 family protein n=1 Tax=Streptomyces sp. KR80 TaxID=3457426 RepID=UPI003FD226D3